MSTESPAVALGLPRTVNDPDLNAHFGRFVQQLRFAADKAVILSNPAMFAVPITEEIFDSPQAWSEHLPPSSQDALLLLSILCLPFEPHPKGVMTHFDDEEFRLFWPSGRTASLAEGDSLAFGWGTLRGRRLALSDVDLHRLIERLPRRAPIETLATSFMGGQPGNYSHSVWQVARWSDEWASVYCVEDAGNGAGYPFPWFLGFCKTNGVERNFVTLLREGTSHFDGCFYATYGTVTNRTRWRLAALALIINEDGETPPWELIEDLLTLDDAAVGEVLHRCTTKGARSAVERLRAIRLEAEEVGLSELSLAQLLERADAGYSLARLNMFLRQCRVD